MLYQFKNENKCIRSGHLCMTRMWNLKRNWNKKIETYVKNKILSWKFMNGKWHANYVGTQKATRPNRKSFRTHRHQISVRNLEVT